MYSAAAPCAVFQVDTTIGLLFERPMQLSEYATKGYDLVSTGFRPFFPILDTMTAEDQAQLQSEFCAEASLLGRSMLNTEGLVEDRHYDLWVTAKAVHAT